MKQVELIDSLKRDTQKCIELVESFMQEPADKLQHQKSEGSWNALQCLEHLNRYSLFYLNEFSAVIKAAKAKKSKAEFISGFWGKKFTNGMLPDDKMKTMKTFKNKDPLVSEVDNKVMNQFVSDQKQFLNLLESAKLTDLTKNNCSITIPLLKMRLGDTLRFYTFHNIRHVDQAQRAIQASGQ